MEDIPQKAASILPQPHQYTKEPVIIFSVSLKFIVKQKVSLLKMGLKKDCPIIYFYNQNVLLRIFKWYYTPHKLCECSMLACFAHVDGNCEAQR